MQSEIKYYWGGLSVLMHCIIAKSFNKYSLLKLNCRKQIKLIKNYYNSTQKSQFSIKKRQMSLKF